ncbi:MAG: hypothetical protein MJ197_09390, partial [Bacteroidales bacterium]|nr:hypothetical protein [Bacteroidales bacterium]
MPQKLDTESFIKRSQAKHGDRYDYSLVDYVNSKSKVKIVCPDHGLFEQVPSSHLQGVGCPTCAGVVKLTTEEFIEKARRKHGDRYDYSLVKYTKSSSKVM